MAEAAAVRLRSMMLACAGVLLLGALWSGGFASFNQYARRPPQDPPPADGIVVLTGGAERVETGLRLLAAGRAPLLLVSGVGQKTDLGELVRHIALSQDQAARVTLGRRATTTVGNAMETADWVRSHGMHSLIVVTAGYHMPRALIELGRSLPGVALHAVAVQPPALRGGMEFTTIRMMANEYDKYLAVWMGLTRKAGS